jgi:hypothetical protein
MISEIQFKKFQKLIERLERQRSEAIGELNQIKKTLKKEFGVDNLKEARKLQLKLEKSCEEEERRFIRYFNKFVREYGKHLRTMEGVDKELLQPIPVPKRATKKTQEEASETKTRNQIHRKRAETRPRTRSKNTD